MVKTRHDASKLHQPLTLAQVGALEQKTRTWVESELDKLMELPREERMLKVEHGLYGRMRVAEAWLTGIQRVVVGVASDAPVIKLPSEVSVALWDAYVDLS